MNSMTYRTILMNIYSNYNLNKKQDARNEHIESGVLLSIRVKKIILLLFNYFRSSLPLCGE
jgi:hypothetical protein